MEDKLENLQALIEGSGLGDVRQKVRGMSEARVLWVLDGYKIDGLPSGREFFIEWDSLEHVQNQLRELADGGYDADDDVAQMMNDLVPVDTAYSRMRKVRASLKFFAAMAEGDGMETYRISQHVTTIEYRQVKAPKGLTFAELCDWVEENVTAIYTTLTISAVTCSPPVARMVRNLVPRSRNDYRDLPFRAFRPRHQHRVVAAYTTLEAASHVASSVA